MWISFGRIRKAHGIKGEVLLSSDSGYWPQPFPKKVRIEGKNIFGEREIVQFRKSCKGSLLQFKGCENRQSAQLLQGCTLYLNRREFQSQKGDFLFLSELQGFSVIHAQTTRTMGIVSHFLSHSCQDFIVIQKPSKQEFEVPFVKAYIHKIDFDQKILYLNLPEEFPNI